MMVIRIPSKFELMRFCKATGAVARATLGTPSPDELGFAKWLSVQVRHMGGRTHTHTHTKTDTSSWRSLGALLHTVVCFRRLCQVTCGLCVVCLSWDAAMPSQEIGGTMCTVLRQDAALGKISTVVLRGSTEGFLDDVERAVNDGVNAFKTLTRDSRTVPAGGAAEIEIARQLAAWGKKQTGLEQYAIDKFAEAFEVVPRTLAENSGLNASDAVSALYTAHAQGQANTGETRVLACLHCTVCVCVCTSALY